MSFDGSDLVSLLVGLYLGGASVFLVAATVGIGRVTVDLKDTRSRGR